MNGRAVLRSNLVVVGGLTFGTLAWLTGCQKERPAATAKVSRAEAADEVAVSAQAAVKVAAQTTCPVMGGPIDKSMSVEYKGKKVYFCCKGCVAQFQKDPEKYLAKLPQFAE